jgi:RNA polymerase sigma-70 factor, ECF subfamily
MIPPRPLGEGTPERASGGSTSRSLLNEARLADAAAWERLVTLYAPLVASWCRRWGVRQQDIVDVLQEVFSAVAAHLHRFRKDRPGDTFRGWLMTISRNKTLDYFQRKNREPAAIGGTEASLRLQEIRDPSDQELPSPLTDGKDDLVFNDVLLRALESIRGEFHERTWQAFWKVVIDGRTAADVAADLAMKPGTVRVSKSRVLLRLRRELGDISE